MNATRPVTTMTLIAFLLWFLGHDAFSKERSQLSKATGDFVKPYLAWGVLYVLLTAGTDFEPTAKISVGLSALILLSVTIVYGPSVFEKITAMFAEANTPSPLES